jgi:hypothetical protein
MELPNQRHLFDIQHGGRTLTVAVRGHKGRRIYVGYINGRLAALGRAKGEMLRRLVQLARTFPKASFRSEVAPETACR